MNLIAQSSGGTPPFTSQIIEGVLPSGTSVAPGEFRLVGTPDVPGGYQFALKGTDVATSTDTGRTTAVVCVPFGPTPLAMGEAACGFYFDAVFGTSTSLSIKTSKKRSKRPLTVTMIDTDGTTELPATVKLGAGKASVSGFVAPKTGRFFCVLASAAGDVTELAGLGKITAPKGGSGASPDGNFVAGKTLGVNVGALGGAVLSFAARPDKSGLSLKAAYMIDPAGTFVTFAAGEVTQKAGGFSVTKTLSTAGTWKFVIGASPGPQGAFTYSFKLKQPKGVAFAID